MKREVVTKMTGKQQNKKVNQVWRRSEKAKGIELKEEENEKELNYKETRMKGIELEEEHEKELN